MVRTWILGKLNYGWPVTFYRTFVAPGHPFVEHLCICQIDDLTNHCQLAWAAFKTTCRGWSSVKTKKYRHVLRVATSMNQKFSISVKVDPKQPTPMPTPMPMPTPTLTKLRSFEIFLNKKILSAVFFFFSVLTFPSLSLFSSLLCFCLSVKVSKVILFHVHGLIVESTECPLEINLLSRRTEIFPSENARTSGTKNLTASNAIWNKVYKYHDGTASYCKN